MAMRRYRTQEVEADRDAWDGQSLDWFGTERHPTQPYGRSDIRARATNIRCVTRRQIGGADAKLEHVPRPLRLALTPSEAAQALGCSRDFFDKHIGPDLRWVRRGRLKFVAIAEIEDWLRRSAALTLDRLDERRFG
jgi:hypothetical protein